MPKAMLATRWEQQNEHSVRRRFFRINAAPPALLPTASLFAQIWDASFDKYAFAG